VINLADGQPASRADVLRYAAKLLGINPPQSIPFEAADLSPMARSFYTSSRQIRSHIIGTELGLKLNHPNYKSGLEALYNEESF
jgi:hypothetical protein